MESIDSKVKTTIANNSKKFIKLYINTIELIIKIFRVRDQYIIYY